MEVIVGSGWNQATWNIPQALLSRFSHYFLAILSRTMKHGVPEIHKLPEFDPNMFQHFIRWIYFATLPPIMGVDEKGVYMGFRLWVIGEKLIADDFADAVMERIYQLHVFADDGPGQFRPVEVDWCWQNTHDSSLLRVFLLDTLSQHWIHLSYIQEDKAKWEKILVKNPRISQQLIMAVAGLGGGQNKSPTYKSLATYLFGSQDDECGCTACQSTS